MEFSLETLGKAVSATTYVVTLFLLVHFAKRFLSRRRLFHSRFEISLFGRTMLEIKDKSLDIALFLCIAALNVMSGVTALSIPGNPLYTTISVTRNSIENPLPSAENPAPEPEKERRPDPNPDQTDKRGGAQTDTNKGTNSVGSEVENQPFICNVISITAISFPFFFYLFSIRNNTTREEKIASAPESKQQDTKKTSWPKGNRYSLPFCMSVLFSIGFSMIDKIVLFEGTKFNLFQLNNVASDSTENPQKKEKVTTNPITATCDPEMAIGPFKSGSSSTLEGGADIDRKIEDIRRRLLRIQQQDGLALILVVGSTDNRPLDKNLRRRFDSNSGLGQDRAMFVMKRLRDANTLSATMLTLSTGPSHTTSLHAKQNSEAEIFRQKDRSVKVCFFSTSNNHLSGR